MQISNLRNQLHLHGNQVLVLLFTALSFSASGQFKGGGGNYNYQEFQGKNYYFGITLGYNTSDYKVFRNNSFIGNTVASGVESAGGPGFNLQIISNLRLGEYFDIRFLPGFAFGERNFEFDSLRRNAPPLENKIESVFIELPFHVRYKSAPYHDKRFFVTGGLKYIYDIQAKSRYKQSTNLIRISATDFAVEYGFGIQMFFPYFIFSPEFKISQGLGNILIYNPNLPTSGILEKVYSRTFTLSLHFEG
jgi:hypothetical protein